MVPEGQILILLNVKSPFSVMVLRSFLVAFWFVVAASWLKNVSTEIWKQYPGAKVCFLVMLRSSMSYNKVVKCFFLLADK